MFMQRGVLMSSSLIDRAELANYLYKDLFDKIHASTNRRLYYPSPSDSTILTGLSLQFNDKQELTTFAAVFSITTVPAIPLS